jgi:hypothetical protein
VPLTTTAPSVGYLALTMKSYGNTTASHEVNQCFLTELKDIVGSPYTYF